MVDDRRVAVEGELLVQPDGSGVEDGRQPERS
jgi:hypothetical protein